MADDIHRIPKDHNPNDFRYFFVTYSIGPFGGGSTMVRQKKSNQPIDHGLNYSAASTYLISTLQMPAYIQFVQETTHQRYVEWESFMASLPTLFKFFKAQGPVLSVHSGGGEQSDKKTPTLHAVKPPEDEKPPTQ